MGGLSHLVLFLYHPLHYTSSIICISMKKNIFRVFHVGIATQNLRNCLENLFLAFAIREMWVFFYPVNIILMHPLSDIFQSRNINDCWFAHVCHFKGVGRKICDKDIRTRKDVLELHTFRNLHMAWHFEQGKILHEPCVWKEHDFRFTTFR